jgi:hypothetical protein
MLIMEETQNIKRIKIKRVYLIRIKNIRNWIKNYWKVLKNERI